MIIFLSTMVGFLFGGVFLMGWGSLDAVCECVPLTDKVAVGTMGLFSVSGFVLGVLLFIFLLCMEWKT